MWAHEDIAGVQISLQKVLFGFINVDSSEWCLWEGVCWDESKAVKANLMDAVDGLLRKYPSIDIVTWRQNSWCNNNWALVC